MELMDENGKTYKVNVQGVKSTYPVEKLIKCLLDDKAGGCAAKYCAHLIHLKDLNWSLKENV